MNSRTHLTAVLAGGTGLVVALFIGWLTWVTIGVGTVASYDCTSGRPPDAVLAALAGLALAGSLASFLSGVSRPRLSFALLAVATVAGAAWFAIGGAGAADCAIGV